MSECGAEQIQPVVPGEKPDSVFRLILAQSSWLLLIICIIIIWVILIHLLVRPGFPVAGEECNPQTEAYIDFLIKQELIWFAWAIS